jgi:hypothetical protein
MLRTDVPIETSGNRAAFLLVPFLWPRKDKFARSEFGQL